MAEHKLIGLSSIAIDLDGTILEMDWERWGREGMEYFGDPKPGAIDTIKKLQAAGFNIIIYTCRVNVELNPDHTVEELARKIKNALDERGVPYDGIWIGQGKPITPIYIDDRAIEFKDNWKEIGERILDPHIRGLQKEIEKINNTKSKVIIEE